MVKNFYETLHSTNTSSEIDSTSLNLLFKLFRLVCNPGKTPAGRALALSLSYAGKAGRAAMKKAADRAWARVSLFPVPASQQVVVQAGQPFTQQLAVSGGSRSGPAARWSATSLPPGVSLSPEGVLFDCSHCGGCDRVGIFFW